MVEQDRNIHLNLLELNYLYRYNLFINLVIPAQAGTQTHPHGKLSDKTVSSIPRSECPPARE